MVASPLFRDCTAVVLRRHGGDGGAGLDIGYVPAVPHAFFRLSGQFGPQQFIFYWPAGPVALISVVNMCTTFSVDLSRARIIRSRA